MDLPEPPAPSQGETRAPVSGLKLMVLILAVFVLLAGYGLWEVYRRPRDGEGHDYSSVWRFAVALF